MMQIIERENRYITEIEKAYKDGYKLYIFGGGQNARAIYEQAFLRPEGKIPLEAFVIRDEYYDQLQGEKKLPIYGNPVIPLREVDLEDEHIFMCLGYYHYYYNQTDAELPKIKGRFLRADAACFFEANRKYLDYDYYEKHRAKFEDIYSRLADEKSRQVLEAYINQKISGKFEYLKDLWEKNQYFPEMVELSQVRSFVDCGAYDGDSYEGLLRAYKERTGKDYPGRAYLWEPEPENLKKLWAKYGGKDNIIIVEKGAWHEPKTLYFSGGNLGGGTGGHIAVEENSGTKIEVDSIDNVVDEPMDFIKMDIEGAEYEALLGAEKAIKKNHPILAICVYHRRDDLLRIPDLIQNFDSSYKFYLRAHLPHAADIVLYAV